MGAEAAGRGRCRYGDDRTVIFPRQGRASFAPIVMRHARDSAASVDIASRVMQKSNEWGAEVAFFDDTVGWAHGAVDVMRAGRPFSGGGTVRQAIHQSPLLQHAGRDVDADGRLGQGRRSAASDP